MLGVGFSFILRLIEITAANIHSICTIILLMKFTPLFILSSKAQFKPASFTQTVCKEWPYSFFWDKRMNCEFGSFQNIVKLWFCCCSVSKLCPILRNPVDHSTPAPSVLHYLLEFAQIHGHWSSDFTVVLNISFSETSTLRSEIWEIKI